MNRLAILAVIAVLASISISTGIGLIYMRGKSAAEKAQHDKEISQFVTQVEKSNEINKNLETQLDTLRAQKEKLNEGWANETTKPSETIVYNSCNLPIGGLQLLNQARLGINQSTASR